MSHPTKAGFSCPPICSDSGREFRAIGVAHARQQGCFIIDGASWFAAAVGVAISGPGHDAFRALVLRSNLGWSPGLDLCVPYASLCTVVEAVGVDSQQPPPFPQMRRANI